MVLGLQLRIYVYRTSHDSTEALLYRAVEYTLDLDKFEGPGTHRPLNVKWATLASVEIINS